MRARVAAAAREALATLVTFGPADAVDASAHAAATTHAQVSLVAIGAIAYAECTYRSHVSSSISCARSAEAAAHSRAERKTHPIRTHQRIGAGRKPSVVVKRRFEPVLCRSAEKKSSG